MPDFNPDKERGQGRMKWVVRNAHKGQGGPRIKKIKTGKGELKLDDKGRCLVSDPALAAEIRKDYPLDLAVSRIFVDHPGDRGHHYFWGSWPEMPWKRQHRDTEAQEGREAQDDRPAEEQEQEA